MNTSNNDLNVLQWTARTDRRLVGPEGGQRHVLIEVRAPRREREDDAKRPPLNLGLVIDASGSMSGEPLAAAIRAAIGVVERLRKRDRLTVVSFASDVVVHVDAIRCNGEGRGRAIAAIGQLRTRGCTDLASGWLTGCERVAQAMGRKAGVQNRVILLSDGYANQGVCDPRELGRHAAELRQRGLYTSCVGIGDHYSPVQLEAIAEHGGGRLHDAPLGEDIVSVVLGELGEIMETAADDVRLTVVGAPGMELGVLGPYACETGAGMATVNLGSLGTGARRQVVVRVGVPRGEVGGRFDLELRPAWVARGSRDFVSGEALSVGFAVVDAAEAAAEAVDQSVARIVAEMWQRDVVMGSTLLNTEGKLGDARERVRGALDEMVVYCQAVAGTEDLVDELRGYGDEVGKVMGSRRSKEQIIAAKMALKSERDYRRPRGGRAAGR